MSCLKVSTLLVLGPMVPMIEVYGQYGAIDVNPPFGGIFALG